MTQESVEAEFGIDLVDVSEESLMSVLTSSESVLSAAIERILEEGKATSIASAGFQAFHP
jgi:acetolactate synthase small subunit